jgi:hypothetical protein
MARGIGAPVACAAAPPALPTKNKSRAGQALVKYWSNLNFSHGEKFCAVRSEGGGGGGDGEGGQ